MRRESGFKFVYFNRQSSRGTSSGGSARTTEDTKEVLVAHKLLGTATVAMLCRLHWHWSKQAEGDLDIRMDRENSWTRLRWAYKIVKILGGFLRQRCADVSSFVGQTSIGHLPTAGLHSPDAHGSGAFLIPPQRKTWIQASRLHYHTEKRPCPEFEARPVFGLAETSDQILSSDLYTAKLS